MLGLVPLLLATVTSLPFSIIDNRIVVPVNLNGIRGFQMILDTGTNGIGITPETAAKLHLRTQRGSVVTGAGPNSVVLRNATLRDIALGERRIRSATATVVDLSTIRRIFKFPQLDGIVGYDALPARYVGVDPSRRILTLSDAPIAAPPNAHRTAFTRSNGLLQVPVSIDGMNTNAILDTGDRSAFTIFEPFARANNFYGITPAHANVVTGYGIGGPIRANVIGVHLDVFGYALPDLVTRVPLGNAGVFSTGTQAGSVGNGTLLRFNTIYDRVAQTITTWPARSLADPPAPHAAATLPRHALFGAVMADKGGSATIVRVLPQSAAASAGFLPGDVISGLNAVSISNTASFLAALHALHGGDRASVRIVRGTVKQERSVTLGTPPSESDPLVRTVYGAIRVDGTLRRTLLTLPKGANGRLPAVLVIGGIGCYTIDAAANPQDAYMRLSHDLSSAGFAVMRIEKSGVGDSQGPPCRNVDFEAEKRGYVAALAALKADPRIDSSRVYLFGHSIGSVVAPQLALTNPVAGVMVAEAVGRDWPEYEVRNLRRQLELGGTSATETDRALIAKQSCMERLLFQKLPEEQIEHASPECKEHNGVYPVDPPYMQQVAPIDIIALWAKIDVPVLAIYGQSDFVTEAPDHERIIEVVNAHHPGSATFVSIDGMDHLLFKASTRKAALDAFSNNLPREYAAEFSRAIVSWLQGHAIRTPDRGAADNRAVQPFARLIRASARIPARCAGIQNSRGGSGLTTSAARGACTCGMLCRIFLRDSALRDR